MIAIHQLFATFEPGAIGEHGLRVQQALREDGHGSEIFYEFAKGGFEDFGHLHTSYGNSVAARDDDVMMYHMALGSNVADWLFQINQRVVLAHHNITPAEYYQPWDPGVTYGMVWGRDQLRRLAPRTALGIGMSEYNRRELEALHYAPTAVAPILLDLDAHDAAADEDELRRLLDTKRGTDWLFVGWIAPHKCQHDIIRAFALFRRLYDPGARLHLVGRVGEQRYHDTCVKLIAELGLTDAVFLSGRVSDGELIAHYRVADVLVCMSEHEGVGLPLLEAMHHRVPVVAFAAAAVPETVGNAGVVLSRKTPAVVAAAVWRVTSDPELADQLRDTGNMQVKRFSLEQAKKRLFSALQLLD